MQTFRELIDLRQKDENMTIREKNFLDDNIRKLRDTGKKAWRGIVKLCSAGENFRDSSRRVTDRELYFVRQILPQLIEDGRSEAEIKDYLQFNNMDIQMRIDWEEIEERN